MMLRVGQKVVCISERYNDKYPGCIVPKKGAVYTVREFDDSNGLRLVEIVNSVGVMVNSQTGCRSINEPSFYKTHFRPAVKTKTDISIFKKMLTPKREDACTSS